VIRRERERAGGGGTYSSHKQIRPKFQATGIVSCYVQLTFKIFLRLRILFKVETCCTNVRSMLEQCRAEL